jgi:transposase-like protein
MYLYRAVDKAGKTVDFYLSSKRDVTAAQAFLRKAMKGQRIPTKITLDAYAASHRAVADLKKSQELPKRVQVRSSKYLNNLIEQDHRRIKHRLGPMLGLKSFRTAAVVDRCHRTGRENQERPVQNRQARRTVSDDTEDLAKLPWLHNPNPLIRQNELSTPTYLEIAPEPSVEPGAASTREFG